MDAEKHRHIWNCACGNRLRITSTEEREGGPHNFQRGSRPSSLNWNGLAEERGWKTLTVGDETSVTCPVCLKKAKAL